MARMRKAWALAPYIDDLHEVMEGRDGALSATERALLENALAFGEIVANDASTPRGEMVVVRESDSLDAVMKVFAESNHTRLPVVGESLDDVKGFALLQHVVAKMLALHGKEEEFRLAEIVRPLPVVQESMPLPKVLQVMRRAKVTMVLVVDELGGTSGILCLRDILTELVEDVDDVQYAEEDAPLRVIGGNRYVVRGDLLLEDFDAAAGTALFRKFGDDVETVGGAVLRAAGRMPARGDRVKLMPKVEALVVATNGRKILGVEIRMIG